MAGALLLMLLGIILPLSAAALLLVGLALFFNWLLKYGKGTGAAMPAPRNVPPPRRQPVPTAPPTVTHSFTGVLTAFFVVAVALVVPYSFRRFQAPSAAVVPAPAPAAAIDPVAASGPPDSAGTDATTIPPASAAEDVASAALPNTPAERRRLLAEFAAQVGRLFGRSLVTSENTAASAGGGPVSLGESRNGEVVILELTQPMVRQLLGDAAGDLLQDMQSRLPQDIRESYALIPLGSSLGNALPPVPPRLAASGLSSLADSLVSILSTEGSGELAAIPVQSPPPQPRPAWIDNPPPNSRVVRITQVGNTSVEQERTERLTLAARQLLLEQATTEQLSREYHAVIRTLPINTQDYLLTPPWSETDEADLGSASGKQPVTTEYHLVSLPQGTVPQDLPGVTDRVRSLRTLGIAGCTATFWLGLLALTISSPLPAPGRLPRAWINRLGIAAAGILLVATVFLGTLVGNGRLAERTADILDARLSLGR